MTGDVVGVVGLALGEGAGAGRAGATRAVDEADVTAERVCLVVCFLLPCWWLDVGCFGWWCGPVWVAATATDVLAIARMDARATTVIFRRQPRLTSRATKIFKRITSCRRRQASPTKLSSRGLRDTRSRITPPAKVTTVSQQHPPTLTTLEPSLSPVESAGIPSPGLLSLRPTLLSVGNGDW